MTSSPIFIAGPTAVGKSAVALALAERIGGEIVSVDSMQVYRGLDIGTAKPTLAEQKRVPHHLIDVVDLSEPFDAARFVQLAGAAVAEIQKRGHVPIFCGGTGLYFKGFSEGLGEAPPSDPKLRLLLESTPLPELLAELESADPVCFQQIDRQNPRRVVRALEVIRLTQKPFSAQRSEWTAPVPSVPASRSFGLVRSAGDLHERINRRVDEMFASGLVSETQGLLARGLAENRTAMQALGYRQVAEHLNGVHTLDQTVELVKIRTRQFSKRQLTWFRRKMHLEWLNLTAPMSPDSVADHITASLDF